MAKQLIYVMQPTEFNLLQGEIFDGESCQKYMLKNLVALGDKNWTWAAIRMISSLNLFCESY